MTKRSSTITGKHMAMIFIVGFGIVIAVNLFMALRAVDGFHGTVVDNSYVASQKYNGWIAEAEKEGRLGWQVDGTQRADGRIVLTAAGVPADATFHAVAERPLGERETTVLTFTPDGANRWVSREAVDQGRWQVVVRITAATGSSDPQVWSGIVHLP